jgi:hypothetical protein
VGEKLVKIIRDIPEHLNQLSLGFIIDITKKESQKYSSSLLYSILSTLLNNEELGRKTLSQSHSSIVLLIIRLQVIVKDCKDSELVDIKNKFITFLIEMTAMQALEGDKFG